MKILIILGIAIVAAFVEGMTQPWTSLFGVSLPLTFLIIGGLGLFQPAVAPMAGLVAGIVLDVTSLNHLGSGTLFYFVIGLLARYENARSTDPRGMASIRLVIMLGCAAFVYPWYSLLVNGQYDQASREVALLATTQASIVMLTVGLTAAAFSRKRLRL